MDALYRHEPTMTPAEAFACLYHGLRTFGADVRGYDAVRPPGRLHPPRRDPLSLRQLAAELKAVDTLAGLLDDLVEEYVTEPEQSFDRQGARILLAGLCATAQDCQTGLSRHVRRLVGPAASLPLIDSVNWPRQQARLMAPWS